jgi:SPP1 family predicted phage head-tail adaptor
VNVGELRHPIEVLTYSSTQDPVTGEIIEGWAVTGQVWGKVEGISGNAFIAASAEQRQTNLRVTLAQQELDALQNRLRFQGKDHKIEAVLPNNVPALMTAMVSRLA